MLLTGMSASHLGTGVGEMQQGLTCPGIAKDHSQALEFGETDLVGGISRDGQMDVGWNAEIRQVTIQPVIRGHGQVVGKGGVCTTQQSAQDDAELRRSIDGTSRHGSRQALPSSRREEQ